METESFTVSLIGSLEYASARLLDIFLLIIAVIRVTNNSGVDSCMAV